MSSHTSKITNPSFFFVLDFDCRALGKNVSPTKASPLKESILCYIQTCHLWDTGVEMSPKGAIRLTPVF